MTVSKLERAVYELRQQTDMQGPRQHLFASKSKMNSIELVTKLFLFKLTIALAEKGTNGY